MLKPYYTYVLYFKNIFQAVAQTLGVSHYYPNNFEEISRKKFYPKRFCAHKEKFKT